MRKWFMLVLAFLTGFGVCYRLIQYRADQGFVQAEDGTEWRLKRMQAFGIAGEQMAVYELVR